MRGRFPYSLADVDKLPYSETARQRFQCIVQTLNGKLRVLEACALLGISEPRFEQLRQQVVEGSLAGLEPRQGGRKAKVPSPEEAKIQQLQAENARLRQEMQVRKTREEIALAIGRVAPEADAEEKKTPLPPKPRGRPPKPRPTPP